VTADDAPGGDSRGGLLEAARFREGFVASLAGAPVVWGALVVVGLAAVRANLLLSVAIAVAAVAVIRALG